MRYLITAVALLVLPACSAPVRTAQRPEPGERALRVVSFNVNFGLAGDPATRRAIFAHDADVICLQETTARWAFELRADPAIEAYPYMRFLEAPGAGGQAILSRLPLLDVQARGAPEGGWFPALRAVVDFHGEPVQILALHLRPPISDGGSYVSGYWHSDDIHTAEIERHWQLVESGMPTVVLGDFNEGAGGAAVEWLEARGMRNALPEFDPDAHTWRWQTWIGRITHDLDHVLYGRGLEVLDARAEAVGRSDHIPVVVDLVRRDVIEPVRADEPSSLSSGGGSSGSSGRSALR